MAVSENKNESRPKLEEESARAAFLRICMEQVRCKNMRSALAEEMQAHMDDQKEAYRKEGKTEQEAERLAVRQMGDPVECGIAFDRVHRPRMDWYAVGMILAAALVGAALYTILYLNGIVGKSLFLHFLEGTLAGIPVMIGVCFVDYTVLGKYPRAIWISGVLLTLLITFQTGEVNGIKHVEWVILLLMPLFAGVVYCYRGQGYGGILKVLAFFGGSCLVLYICTALDRSSVRMLFTLGCVGMLLLAIGRGWYGVPKKTAPILGSLFLAGWTAVWGYTFIHGNFRRQRILAWINPEEYADGAGYVAVQMGMVRSRLRWTGSGAAGMEWMQQVMQTQENYLFLSILQCFGILVSAVVLLLLIRLGLLLFHKVHRIQNRLGYLTGTACCLTFAVPLFLHVAVNLGFVPVTDCFLPFFSGGGKSCVAFYAVLGLLLSVFRNRECAPENGYKTKRVVGKY